MQKKALAAGDWLNTRIEVAKNQAAISGFMPKWIIIKTVLRRLRQGFCGMIKTSVHSWWMYWIFSSMLHHILKESKGSLCYSMHGLGHERSFNSRVDMMLHLSNAWRTRILVYLESVPWRDTNCNSSFRFCTVGERRLRQEVLWATCLFVRLQWWHNKWELDEKMGVCYCSMAIECKKHYYIRNKDFGVTEYNKVDVDDDYDKKILW